ncbi:MAG: glycosyltransferase [Proteobacteria bacterium]|nr:glycosyltransferase [Pseudomonadota bacterium]
MSKRISMLLPDLRGGGAERVSLSLAEEFVCRGYAVELVLMRRVGELLEQAPAGCSIVDLGAPRLRNVWLALHRYFRTSPPAAVLAAMWPVTGVACIAKRTARSPATLVVSEHTDFRLGGGAVGDRDALALKRFGRQLYGAADHLVAVSEGAADALAETTGLPRDRVRVIYNPIRVFGSEDPEPADAGLLEWWAGSPHRLLAVGALKEPKAFDVLVRALAQAQSKVDARLLILGEGALRSQLELEAQRLGVTERVRFPGFRKNPFPFFQRADLFVLSSRWEGFGNVIVEALACGTPVVSTDCMSGPAEILQHGRYGALVPVGDSPALARAMVKALRTEPDRDALKRRAADFSPAIAAEKYLELLFPAPLASAARVG